MNEIDIDFDEDNHEDDMMEGEIYDIIRLLGRKHALKVIHTIKHTPASFNDLKTQLNISASMLSDLLSDFQLKSIIEKCKVSTSPAKYEYKITESFGVTLCGIIGELILWEKRRFAETNATNVKKIDMEG